VCNCGPHYICYVVYIQAQIGFEACLYSPGVCPFNGYLLNELGSQLNPGKF
jgi:hypothetical protein